MLYLFAFANKRIENAEGFYKRSEIHCNLRSLTYLENFIHLLTSVLIPNFAFLKSLNILNS